MPQAHVLNNQYLINDVAGWPALFNRLQESSGQPVVDIAHEYEYDVGGQGDPKHIYNIRIQSSSLDLHETKYLIVKLGGKDLVNDPMHNLRSAEELIETMITLREFNQKPGRVFAGEEQVAIDARLTHYGVNTEVQRFAFESAVGGINNFFQVYDPLSWLETVGMFQAEHGHNLDSGELIAIKTSRDGIETGIYTVQKTVVSDKAGVLVTQDGQPFWNYGKPQTSTAEQVVALIEKLRKNFGSIPIGKEFNFNPDNSKPLVASVKNGETEVKLFANGTITIYHPGLVAWNAPGSDVVMLEGLAETLESHLAAPGRDVDDK
jgi:hypothetical protein